MTATLLGLAARGVRSVSRPGGRCDLRLATLVAMVLAVLCAGLHVAAMRNVEAAGLLDANDVLFDADVPDALSTIGHGKRSIRKLHPLLPNSVHPLWWAYFAPVIRGAAKIAHALHVTDMDEIPLRATLGLYVAPAVSAAQSFAFTLLLCLLDLPLAAVLLFGLLNIAAFANLIFGTIPEHFIVTDLMVTLLLLLVVAARRRAALDRPRLWFPLGVLTTGINITNVAFVGIAHMASRVLSGTARPWKAGVRSTLFTLGVLASVLALGATVGLTMDRNNRLEENYVARFLRDGATLPHELGRAAQALANAVAPATLRVESFVPPRAMSPFGPEDIRNSVQGAVYPRFSFERPAGTRPAIGALGLVAIAAMGLGGALMIARGGTQRIAAATAFGIVAFNLVLHTLWGLEFFLYAPHWIAPSLVLMTGLFLAPTRMHRVLAAGTAIYVAAVCWNNAELFRQIMSAAADLSG